MNQQRIEELIDILNQAIERYVIDIYDQPRSENISYLNKLVGNIILPNVIVDENIFEDLIFTMDEDQTDLIRSIGTFFYTKSMIADTEIKAIVDKIFLIKKDESNKSGFKHDTIKTKVIDDPFVFITFMIILFGRPLKITSE